jgi:predicted regulator of Ras-like GTPase activity (Roadblock/LC7/MglB family)
MQGKLNDMSVADLIQHNCLDGKTARLSLKSDHQQATVYFDSGEIVHAVSGSLEGEEVIYHILEWDNGTFQLDAGKKPPRTTIDQGWTSLLLEGARRLDEQATAETRPHCPVCGAFLDQEGQCKNPRCSRFVSNPNRSATHQKNNTSNRKEKTKMAKTRGQSLADALSELLTESSDIEGAAIVGHDGLVYAANVPMRDLDDEMVGAISAAVLGMSRRGTTQLKRGAFTRTLIQGEDGNIIVSEINDETLLVGLTPKNVNLGMAFMEIRTMTENLHDIL